MPTGTRHRNRRVAMYTAALWLMTRSLDRGRFRTGRPMWPLRPPKHGSVLTDPVHQNTLSDERSCPGLLNQDASANLVFQRFLTVPTLWRTKLRSTLLCQICVIW